MTPRYSQGFLIFGLILMGILGEAAWMNHEDTLLQDHISPRLARIVVDLAAASPQSIILAGNSHAELAAQANLPTCYAWINAEISGAKASYYAAAIKNITVPVPVHAAILLVGTNDILRQANPLSEASKFRFANNVTQIVQWLHKASNNVTVVAVPPIGSAASKRRDPKAVSAYSQILQHVCLLSNCRFVYPFRFIRDGDGGLAYDSVFTDAIHLSDYAGMIEGLDMCE